MPYYVSVKPSPGDSIPVRTAKQRAANRLVKLKETLDTTVPPKRVDGSLLLATWNIRELGEGNFRGWAGETLEHRAVSSITMREEPGEVDDEPGLKGRFWESIFYLAEVINRFDLVALQEVRDDLEDLDLIRKVLGSWWKVLVTDVTAGRQGNRERVAFLYDERKIKFGGLAGEVVLPPNDDKSPAFQLARTPYLLGFQAGWFKFTICSTHLYYGESKADDPQRLKEMDLLARFLAAEVKRPTAWARNMILLGDFNVFTTGDKQFEVLTKTHKFVIPKKLMGAFTNASKNKPYDQIAFIAPSVDQQLAAAAVGVVPLFDTVFTDNEEAEYVPLMGGIYEKDSKGNVRNAAAKRSYYRSKWRTFQISDHNPLWIELTTDFSKEYLKRQIPV